jgi:hypothetical protein
MYTAKSFIKQEGYYTVKLVRSQDKKVYHMDVEVLKKYKDVDASWNQYIFHKNNSDDMERALVQENNDEYMDASSIAIQYLEDQQVILQDDKGDWYDTGKGI